MGTGRSTATRRTDGGGYRRYDLAHLRPEQFHHRGAPRQTIAYVRVSSHDQKDGLERQKPGLALYCARQGGTFEVVADRVGRLVVTHTDRLLRFGGKRVFAICEARWKW